MLMERGAASPRDVEASLAAQAISRARLGRILTARNLASPRDVTVAVADQRGMPFVDLAEDAQTLPEALDKIWAEQLALAQFLVT